MSFRRFRVARPAFFLACVAMAACDGHGATPRAAGVDGGAEPTIVAVYGNTVTNHAGLVTFTVTTTEAAADLELLSSNLLPDPDSRLNYIQWFGEVRNNGPVPLCFVKINIDFKTAEGALVQSMYSFASADPYSIPNLNSVVGCIPPGQTGVFYDNDLPKAPVNVAAIAVVEAKLDLLADLDPVPHPSRPTLSGIALAQEPGKAVGHWIIAGTLTATATIYNIDIQCYPRDANSLVLMQAHAINLETVIAGASWDWDTSTIEGAKPASFSCYPEFLLGAKPSS